MSRLSRMVRSLVGSKSQAKEARRAANRRRASRTFAIEAMEERAMFVIGAVVPVAAAPINQLTGVVRLGGTALNATNPTCSASLLSTGVHLLTAAHCISQNEVQGINAIGATEGAFQLNFNGQITAPIAFNASPATVAAALEALPNIDNVSVSAGPIDTDPTTPDFTWSVEFRGVNRLTNVSQMTVFNDTLVGTSATIATTNGGGPGVGAARFDLPVGNYTINNSLANVTVHPNWQGLYFTSDGAEQAGNDIAIIRLPMIAPQGAQRYGVYTAQDEVGQQFTAAGYGRTGVGATGENNGPPDTANVRRSGLNEFGGIHGATGNLMADFDDGTANNDALGDGLGLALLETAVARGDSGGPNLLGNLVAGINSAISGTGGPGFGDFGDTMMLVRVSDFTQNRDPNFNIATILAAPGPIVLDMNFQDAGNDFANDAIEVRRIGPNKSILNISVNGATLFQQPLNQVTSLSIQGSTDDETFTIFDNLEIPVSVNGGPGEDTLVGGPGAETLSGGDDDDTLRGNGGNDVLSGDGGSDTISGGPGADTLIGGGGGAFDILLESVSGNVLLEDIRLTVNGVIDAISGFEFAQLTGGNGNDKIVVDQFPGATRLYGGKGDDQLTGGAFNDELYGEEGNDTLDGFDGHDSLSGGDGNDDLFGGDGNDTLVGADGNDTLAGGGDSDLLFGGVGNDKLIGGYPHTFLLDLSSDTLAGGEGNDILFGDNGTTLFVQSPVGGDDLIFGEDGNDLVFGQGGNDRVYGGAGNDVISGGLGEDLLVGGSRRLDVDEVLLDGADTIRGNEGNDTIYGDNVSYENVPEADGGAADKLYGDSSDDLIAGQRGDDLIEGGDGDDQLAGNQGNDTLSGQAGVDILDGNEGDDNLSGGPDADTLHGNEGNDLLAGNGGHDSLFGDEGHDTLTGGTFSNKPDTVPDDGNDLLDGGVGNDRLLGDSGSATKPIFATLVGGADTLRGGPGADLLFGMVGNDKLFGGEDSDILVGGTGGDTLRGDDGDDVLNGEADADWIVGGQGFDTLGGGEGDDTLVGGFDDGNVDLSADSLDGGGGHDLLVGDNATFGPLTLNETLGGADTLQGGLGDDIIYGLAGADFIGGGGGNDTIDAGLGHDIANGDSGNDVLYGGEGNDLLAGSAGNDQLFGQAGLDLLVGGNYSNTKTVVAETNPDLLDGGDDNDTLYGDSFALGAPTNYGSQGGGDTLRGGDGDDFLAGQAGHDSLEGNQGNDQLYAWHGDDFADGGEGDDIVQGGSGNDILLGEGGIDSLDGGDGRDILVGGRNADRLSGGTGDDLLISGIVLFPRDPAEYRKAWELVRAEWTSARPYATRGANLKGIDNPEFANRLNEENYLQKGVTVIDDDAADAVLGDLQTDWYLVDELLDTFATTPGEIVN